jgi:uncharacterized protein (DUF1800 family)
VTRRTDPWHRYQPGPQAPWNLRRVVHLHRRAGFAASWHELERDLKEGPEASISRVLAGKVRASDGSSDYKATASLLADAAVATGNPERLKAAWVYRMLCGPDPLAERLTLMWHDHFATSNTKVDDLAAMRSQNDTLRQQARAPFVVLLNAVLRDPALLDWLDAPANRKGHPNENLARELMELFTLGIGNYTEADVKECARALTGWTVANGSFREDQKQHDNDAKTIFGRRGKWTAPELVQALLDHPATARRIAGRLCGLFFGEGGASAGAIAELARGLSEHNLDIGWGVATILNSDAFFAETNIRTRVVGPPEFLVGAAIALGRSEPPPSTLVLADWMARLGQDLFYPPNVGGWPGGRAWLSSRSLVGRANFAAALVEGAAIGIASPLDAAALAAQQGRPTDLCGVTQAAANLLFGTEPPAPLCESVARAAGSSAGSEILRRAVTLLLASPEAQLG